MTTGRHSVTETVEGLVSAAPSGFALAFHINFTTPKLLLQTYSRDWVKYYSENGLVMSDPTVLWGFENDGTKRWSELADLDTANVLIAAQEYQMNYGLTCAVSGGDTRSIGSFARADREYDDAEIARLKDAMETLHSLTASGEAMTSCTIAELEQLSVHVQAS